MLINMTLASIFGREFANSPITFINCREILLPRQSLEREKKRYLCSMSEKLLDEYILQ